MTNIEPMKNQKSTKLKSQVNNLSKRENSIKRRRERSAKKVSRYSNFE